MDIGYFDFLAIINNVAMDICIQGLFVCFLFFRAAPAAHGGFQAKG